MALSEDAADALLNRTAWQIQVLAQAAFARLWELLQGDSSLSARAAIEQVQDEFGEQFTGAMAAAFSDLLRQSIGVAQVKAMQVGALSLSRRLYLHNVETQREVLQVVNDHAKGVHQARELALRLYDGYKPAEGVRRPLEGRARAELPKALRLLTADPAARESLARLVEEGQQQAARLKSPGLRAAYAEAFEAWKSGAGIEALRRKLENAHREKNRFFANRIAQTELARAQQHGVAGELADDDTIDVVQVRINPAHPRTDICDLHARADLYGLGPGNYPKEMAPVPPFHPFCRCRLRSMPSLFGTRWRERPGAAAAYLKAQGLDAAARIMGSRERAQAVLDGASAESVINAGRDPLYRLQRIRDLKWKS